jgi:hypothetical protein
MAVVAVDFDHTLVDGDKPRPYAREAHEHPQGEWS